MRKLTVASINSAARAEHLRVEIEQAEDAVKNAADEQAEAERQNARLVEDVNAVNDYIEGLAKSGENQALISTLKEELAELQNQQNEASQRVVRLKSHAEALKQSLQNTTAELQNVEADHRKTNDQAMKLREHIEKVDR
jgi:chromosome segregation ATPase